MDPKFVLMCLALKSRAQATELRVDAANREYAAKVALQNAEALETILCHGTDEQIAEAAREVPI